MGWVKGYPSYDTLSFNKFPGSDSTGITFLDTFHQLGFENWKADGILGLGPGTLQ